MPTDGVSERLAWKSVIDSHAPLVLPSAPDALTARRSNAPASRPPDRRVCQA